MCDDCDASYVAQTKRKLSTRLREYISDINKKTSSPSVISDHRVNFNHNFRWNDGKILDSESSYNKRLIFEMIQIKRNGLNKQNDTEFCQNPTHIFLLFQSLSLLQLFFFPLHTSPFLCSFYLFNLISHYFLTLTLLSFSESHFKFILSNNFVEDKRY